jgi:hypothetical protein
LIPTPAKQYTLQVNEVKKIEVIEKDRATVMNYVITLGAIIFIPAIVVGVILLGAGP